MPITDLPKMRSWLFAPGDSEKKMTKAMEGSADIALLFIDLTVGDLADAVSGAYTAAGPSIPIAGGAAGGDLKHFFHMGEHTSDSVVAVAISSSRSVASGVGIAPGTALGTTLSSTLAPVIATLTAGVCVFALALTVVAAGRVRVDLVVAARAVSGRARTAAAAVTAPVAAPLAVAVVVSRGLRLGQSAVRVARGGSTHVASRASST